NAKRLADKLEIYRVKTTEIMIGSGRLCPTGGSRLSRDEGIRQPVPQESGSVRVVRWQRAVREVVLVTGVEEELPILGLIDQCTGGVDVALADEERVGEIGRAH